MTLLDKQILSWLAKPDSEFFWFSRSADVAVPLNAAILKKKYQQAQQKKMTYIVNDKCIKCKYMDCVEVCPVDCFYEGENMLVIHPDECIDCGVCEPECPAEAIQPDTDAGIEFWLQVNTEYAEKWPNITLKGEAPADGKDFEGVEGKYEKFFSPKPGKGDS